MQQARTLRPPWVRIIDHALPEKLFGPLLAGVRGLGTERLGRTYQTTFWRGLEEPPLSQVDLAIDHLVKKLELPSDIIGAEWWLSRMYTSNVQVDFHRDRDEKRALAGGRLIHPRLSTVLFLNRCQGGLLAVTAQPPCEANPAFAPNKLDFDLVTPEPNRLAVFRGNRTHGVLDAHNQIPLKRLPKERQLRLSIPINFWHRRPLGVPRFGETKIYKSLSLVAWPSATLSR